mmetsp:Transcript_14447/g.37020  ORF Transcript_14447/g.37020 Transcript_14447/m.37020 type:complete len:200 (+) Transcript_14447:1589-2188(+)
MRLSYLLPQAEQRVASPELGLHHLHDLVEGLRLEPVHTVKLPLQALQEPADALRAGPDHAFRLREGVYDVLYRRQGGEVREGEHLRLPLALLALLGVGRCAALRVRWPSVRCRRRLALRRRSAAGGAALRLRLNLQLTSLGLEQLAGRHRLVRLIARGVTRVHRVQLAGPLLELRPAEAIDRNLRAQRADVVHIGMAAT